MPLSIKDLYFLLPVLVILGVYLFMTHRSRKHLSGYQTYMTESMELNREMLASNRRMIVVLEEISAELKQRKN
jgi:hypothetical protein